MPSLLGVALLALAAVLFYRHVERPHKIIFFKIAGGCLVVLVVFVVGNIIVEKDEETRQERRMQSVTVRYVPDTTPLSNPYRSALGVLTGDTVTAVAFQLCNQGVDTVAKVAFMPQTYRKGRSTGYTIVLPANLYEPTSPEFSSDYILPPRQCVVLTWSGKFLQLDTTRVFAITPTFR